MTNTQKQGNRIGFMLPLFYVAAPTVAILRSIACINDMDGTGYFGSSYLMIACNVATAILTVLFFTHAFSHHRKDSIPKECFCNTPTYVTSATLGGGIAFTIYELISFLINEDGQIRNIENSDIIVIISAICGVAALTFLLLNAIIEEKLSQIKAALGIASSLFFSTYGICIYLDKSVAMNGQQRIITVIALLMMASFMLFETRIPLGRSKWHSYAAFGFMSALMLLYSSVPALVYYIANKTSMPGVSLVQIGLTLTSAIYVIARVSILAFAPEDEVCDLADSILDMAHARKQSAATLARVNNNLKEE